MPDRAATTKISVTEIKAARASDGAACLVCGVASQKGPCVMVRRLLCLLFAVVGMGCLVLPGVASADGLSGYKVKLTGWPTDQAGTSVAVGDVNGDGDPGLRDR